MSTMIIFGDNMGAVDKMKDADAGKLFKALLHHVNGEEPKELPYAVQIVYDLLSGQVDRAEEIAKKRAEAGRKGAESRWQKMAKDGNAMAPHGTAWQTMANDGSITKTITKANNNNIARVKKNSFFDFDQRTGTDLDAIVRKEV